MLLNVHIDPEDISSCVTNEFIYRNNNNDIYLRLKLYCMLFFKLSSTTLTKSQSLNRIKAFDETRDYLVYRHYDSNNDVAQFQNDTCYWVA